MDIYNCNFTRRCNVQITVQMISEVQQDESTLLFDSSNITMLNLTVRDNDGHFMYTQQCNVQITHSGFRNNKGQELLWISQRSKVHVTNTTFIGNQALNHGTLTIESSHLTTVECQFLGNTVKNKGAAVHVRRSEYNDQGSLFTGNIAGEGGKILNVCSSPASQILLVLTVNQ